MDRKVIEDLRREFPDKKVVLLPEDDPQEVIVEVWKDFEESCAVVIIDRSEPHLHHVSWERYGVEAGILTVHVDGETHVVRPGERFYIRPGQVHWAEGDAVRMVVHTWPPWKEEDHILVDGK
ncbi:hypothetical protein AMJ57_02420 [Parcubacteria bacterium SG8_24]|nr:MAG: hypothetical protein AMJ57_02420 [Parcubacteria bacterium SG8_24]